MGEESKDYDKSAYKYKVKFAGYLVLTLASTAK